MKPNCLTPFTPVGGSFVIAVRAFYDGPLVTLAFGSTGTPVTITPGHPVATRDGFARAGDLAVGAHVLRVLPTYPSPTAQETYFALHCGARVVERDAVPTDLNGDATRVHGPIRHVYPVRGHHRDGCSAALDFPLTRDVWLDADRGVDTVRALAESLGNACAWDAVTDVRRIEHAAPGPEDGCFVYDFVSPRRWYTAAGVVVASCGTDYVEVR